MFKVKATIDPVIINGFLIPFNIFFIWLMGLRVVSSETITAFRIFQYQQFVRHSIWKSFLFLWHLLIESPLESCSQLLLNEIHCSSPNFSHPRRYQVLLILLPFDIFQSRPVFAFELHHLISERFTMKFSIQPLIHFQTLRSDENRISRWDCS